MPKERRGQEFDMAASFLPGIGARALMVTGDHREFVRWRWWPFEEVLVTDPASSTRIADVLWASSPTA